MAMLTWMDSSWIPRLVYIAVLGIESYGPLKFADPSVAVLPMDRIGLFYHYALLASLGTLMSVGGLGLLSRWRARSWKWQVPLAAILCAGWCVQAAFVAWVYRDGLHSLSPAWAQHVGLELDHVAWTAAGLNLLVGAIVAFRASRQLIERSTPLPDEKRCFHESRLALVLVTVGAVGNLIPYIMAWHFESRVCLWLALFIFCTSRLSRLRRERYAMTNSAVWQVPPGRFLGYWLAASVTLGLAAPTLGLFSFIFWLGPVNWIRIFERV
jgi:hypothetical protein